MGNRGTRKGREVGDGDAGHAEVHEGEGSRDGGLKVVRYRAGEGARAEGTFLNTGLHTIPVFSKSHGLICPFLNLLNIQPMRVWFYC